MRTTFGVGSVSSPVSAPNGLSGTGVYSCSDDIFEVTIDGITATFDYLGPIAE